MSVSPSIKIIYDNYKIDQDMKAAHGFSCLIDLGNKNILFDTDSEQDILISNMKRMDIFPESIDIVFLSHNHWDHVDGLPAILQSNNKPKLYILKFFSGSVRENIKKYKLPYVEVSKPLEIVKDVYSTGEMGGAVKEQSLILDTAKGLVIITGCAHQGIVEAVKKSKEILGKNIYLVLGGFHLGDKKEKEVTEIIKAFEGIGVNFVGPSHCTGEMAIKMFADAYKKKFIKIGAGKTLSIQGTGKWI